MIPETIPFRTAFLRVFSYVCESGYSQLTEGFEAYEEDVEAFDADLSNAVGETFAALGFSEFTPEDEGTAGDWLREDNPTLFAGRDNQAAIRDAKGATA